MISFGIADFAQVLESVLLVLVALYLDLLLAHHFLVTAPHVLLAERLELFLVTGGCRLLLLSFPALVLLGSLLALFLGALLFGELLQALHDGRVDLLVVLDLAHLAVADQLDLHQHVQ